MPAEYFIVAHSFAAPFFSDDSRAFITAETPAEALEKYAAAYKHPCGLYAAACYTDANAEAKNQEPLARWVSNHEIEKQRLTAGIHGYSFLGHAPGDFEINGVRHRVKNPKGGKVVPA